MEWGGGISAAPLWLAGLLWPDGPLVGRPGGLLIEIVWKGRDARAAARVADAGAFASVLEALIWVRPLGSAFRGAYSSRGCGSRRRGLG